MNLAFVGWLFLCLESATATATQCLSCAPMRSSAQCVTTKTCTNEQKCYAKYVLKPDGTVMYEFGCHDSQICPGQIGTHALIGKRATDDTELCYKCCHGDMCNQGALCTAITATVDPCFPSPCLRGSCFIGSGNNPTFFCLCPSGFNGLHCETVIGSITATTTPSPTTATTTFPTTHVNLCSPSPCVRGTCFISSGNNPTYFCLCPSDYTGLHCETVISTTTAKTTPIQTTTTTVPTTPANPCSPSPCVRGSCYIGSGNIPTFFCLCQTGFTGRHCETEINPCFPSPCVRGSCFIGSGNNPTYFCLCPSDFTGLHCETVSVISTTTAKTTPIHTTTTTVPTTPANPCSPSPCVRGSCYIGSGNIPTFFCLCQPGFTGLHCTTVIATTSSTTTHTTSTTKSSTPPPPGSSTTTARPLTTTTTQTKTTTIFTLQPTTTAKHATCYPQLPRLFTSRYMEGDQSCYEFVSAHRNWNDAEADCRSQGGFLVTIDNVNEQELVHRAATSLFNLDVWIGLNDISYEGHYSWVSGKRPTYSNFGITVSQALNDCVIMRRQDGKWAETHCVHQHLPYVCEYEGHNNPDVSLVG